MQLFLWLQPLYYKCLEHDRNPTMNDAQIIQRLKNMAVDAQLSNDEIKAKVLGEAAARLTELSIMHHTWHPSMEEVNRGL